MINIFFFYGLAFLLMGITIFLMPKEKDLLGLSNSLWLVGLFGVLHGLNEWVDLFILRGGPFDIPTLSLIGSLLLPVSFLCLIVFGTRVLCRGKPALKWLEYLWVLCLAAWLVAYHFGQGFLIAGIAARYFICIPGTFLTAWVLASLFFKPLESRMPKSMRIALGSLVLTFAAYGILSGLIVPKADFLLAGALNYKTFIQVTGLPVQFFRMICAIVLAISFFVVSSVYSNKLGVLRFRGGIRVRILMLVMITVLVTACSATGYMYFRVNEMRHSTLEAERSKSAESLAILIANFIDEKVGDVKGCAADPSFLRSLTKANLKYASFSGPEILKFMKAKDEYWARVPDDNPLVTEAVGGDLGDHLRHDMKNHDELRELFITDRFGGLLAASNRTSDFYQADEKWWVRAFNDGKGAVFIDKMSWDDSAKIMAISIAVPIRDQDGSVVGVCKAVVSPEKFLSPLREFTIGKTGHAEVIDGDGTIMVHPGATPFSKKSFSRGEMRQIEGFPSGKLMTSPLHEGDPRIIVFVEVKDPWLSQSDLIWYVLINQSEKEAFQPLQKLTFQASVMLFLLSLVMIMISFFTGRKIVAPIRTLTAAAADVAGGGLKKKVVIKTGDEFELLANAFNQMTHNLEETMVSRDALAKEIDFRSRAEQEALAAKKNWEESFDAIQDAITIHDMDFNILRANKAAEEILKSSQDVILGNKCYRSYHGKGCPPEGCPSCKVLKTGVSATAEIFEPHLNKFVEVKAWPRFDADHNLIGLVHVVRDITERKSIEEQKKRALAEEVRSREIMVSMLEDNNLIREELEGHLKELKKTQNQLLQSQKMEAVGKLAGGVAHDFNNQLTVIAGFTEYLLKRFDKNDPRHQQLSEIKNAAERSSGLTKRLLAFSRREITVPKVFDLNVQIDELTQMFRQLIGEDIECVVSKGSDLGLIRFDLSQLELVLVNLVVNARDAMKEGGKLTLETSHVSLEHPISLVSGDLPSGDYALLSVSDSGGGMTEEVKGKIFEPFFTTKKKGQGTGLGLSTVYGIVERNGGFIDIWSELGKGTCFKIYIPCVKEAADVLISEKSSEELPKGNETLLLVEDEPSLLRMSAMILRDLGYRVLEAPDGEVALLRVAENEGAKIGLIVTDVVMPRLGGKELANQIKALHPDIKILFISGYTEDADVLEAIHKKQLDFLQKPFTPTKLAFKVREVLDRK